MVAIIKRIVPNSKKKTIFAGIAVIILLSFFILELVVVRRSAVKNRFGDEIAHVVTGHLLINRKKIYKETQNNHQPLVYVFAGATEKLTNPDSFFQLMRRTREAVFLYSAIWSIVFIYFFGIRVIPFIILFEILKFANLGHMLLGESLAVYPYIFLIATLTQRLFITDKVSRLRLVFISFSAFLVLFTLLPLWPSVGLILLNFMWCLRQDVRKTTLLLLPLLILTLVLFTFFSFTDYFRETWLYQEYFFKYSPKPTTEFHILRLLFVPFLFPFYLSSVTGKIACAFFIVLLVGLVLFRKNIQWIKVCVLVIIIMLSNLHTDGLGDGGFHLLPWLGAFTVIPFIFLRKSNIELLNSLSKMFLLLTVALIIITGYQQRYFLIEKRDLWIDYEINYSDSETYSRAINILKDKSDRLIAYPNDPVINWITDVPFATRVIEYYDWIYPIERYNNEIRNTFIKNPPEFVVDTGLTKNYEIERFVTDQLNSNYIRINHLNEPSKLYISKKRVEQITEEQMLKLSQLSFSINQIEK